VGQWVKANPKLTKTIVAVGSGVIALIASLGVLGLVIGPVIKGMGYLGLAFKAAGKTLIWLGRAAMTNPLLAVVALIAIGALYIWSNWETLGPKFKKLWDSIAAWTSEAWEGLTGWLNSAWDGIVEAVKSLPDKFMAIWQSIKNGAVTIFSSYLDWLKSFWGKVFDSVLELPSKFKGAGSAMIDALIDGISAKWESLKAKLTSLTDYLPDWMKSEKTTSPTITTASGSLLPVGPTFAGMYDSGGDIPAGQVGIVGERGPELVGGPVSVKGRRDTATLMSAQQTPAPTINIYPLPGQNPQDIAREVARQIQLFMRTQAASARSAM
jgi:phage-related tail protein